MCRRVRHAKRGGWGGGGISSCRTWAAPSLHQDADAHAVPPPYSPVQLLAALFPGTPGTWLAELQAGAQAPPQHPPARATSGAAQAPAGRG